MNNFNVNIYISDYICASNCQNTLEKDTTLTSTSDTLTLQCNYVLNIVRVSGILFTILLQNGIQTYIRNIYQNESFQICLPCRNGIHIITICGKINN